MTDSPSIAVEVVEEKEPIAALVQGDGPRVVEVHIPGEQGPAGPAGSGAPYRHRQAAASAVWTIPHNLGHRPLVTVLSVGGVVLLAGIVHLSDNTLQVVMDDPFSGEAVCL